MKNLTISGFLTVLIIFAFIGCSKENDDSSNSQYHPLLVSNKIWAAGVDIPWGENPGLQFDSFHKIGSDTIVEGIKWYKYYTSPDENAENFYLYAYLHEESEKIYLKMPDNDGRISIYSSQKLFYDFSLEPGDEIQLNSVFIVDSVKYLPVSTSGEKRKHIYLSPKTLDNDNELYIVWIEGIGSTQGLWHNETLSLPTGSHHVLLCCKENGILIYQDTEYNVCYLGPND